jgi:MFS family permease
VIVPERELVQPPAVQMNTGRIVAVGTGLFFVAFVALLPFYGWLGDHHHRSWLWTALAGWVLGIIGWTIMLRHRRLGRTL